jgi:hypothetical protein
MVDEIDLPEPFVPPEVDLRDFPFTPVYRARLFGSEFHALASADEWRAGVTLWLKSYDQSPAGSLPAADAMLARLAELPLADWLGVRGRALHGWELCSDGRLYHGVIADLVLDAWARKHKISEANRGNANKRWKHKQKPPHAGAMPPQSQIDAAAMPFDANRQGQGQGERQKKVSTAVPSEPAPPAPQGEVILPPITPSPDDRTWLFNEGLFALHSNTGKTGAQLRPVIGKWLKALGDNPAQLRAAIEEAGRQQPADWLGWLHGAVKARVPSIAQPAVIDADRLWSMRLSAYGWRRHGIWPPDAGPNPDQPGCEYPKSILDEWPPLARYHDRKKLRMPLKDDPPPAGWAP